MDKELEKLRKLYISSNIPEDLKTNGWNDLRIRLAEEDEKTRVKTLSFVLAKGFAFTALLIFFTLGGTFGIAQAAKPGDTLFPVKLLSEEIISRTTGDYDLKMERRVEEIMEISTYNPEKLDQAEEEYKKTITETKKTMVKNGKSDEFKNTLELQREKLNQVISKNPKLREQLQKVLAHMEEVRGDIKGDNTENRNTPTQSSTKPTPSPTGK